MAGIAPQRSRIVDRARRAARAAATAVRERQRSYRGLCHSRRSSAPRCRKSFSGATLALATALLIGRAFTARGWEMEPGDEREIGDLPAYTFLRDGEREMQPCAERFLTESQVEALLKAGIVPLASRRDRNAVVAVRFQSVADPPAPLAW